MPERAAGRELLLVAGHATGGIGAHVASLARGLPGLGWRVTVLTSGLTAGRFDLGPHVLTRWPHRGSVVGDLAEVRRRVAAADVVHAHGHQAGVLVTASAATLPARRRPPVVVSWHNAVLDGGARARLLGLGERYQARHADLVTGASGDLVERARSLGARRAEPAPVAAPTPRPVPRQERDPGRTTVLTVSRIAPQKNLEVLVEAAAQVRAPGLRWLVAGDGDPDLVRRLRSLAGQLQAPVEFLGARSDVPELLAGAQLFVLPSLWEARSLAVQEAMAAGLPVIASDVGGLRELLGPGPGAGPDAGPGEGPDGEPVGELVPVGDAPALAVAVDRLLADPRRAEELAEAARRRFATLPTESDVISAWSARYLRLGGDAAERARD